MNWIKSSSKSMIDFTEKSEPLWATEEEYLENFEAEIDREWENWFAASIPQTTFVSENI